MHLSSGAASLDAAFPPMVRKQAVNMEQQVILFLNSGQVGDKAYQEQLRQAGYQVIDVDIITKSLNILETIRQLLPDLVLIELPSPVFDGAEMTQAIRSDPLLAQLPVILLGFHIPIEQQLAGLESGADDFVSARYTPYELTLRVRAVLRRSEKSA